MCDFDNLIEQQICIEGVMMHDDDGSHKNLCETQLEGELKESCIKAVEQGQNGLNRDWKLYVS